MGRKNNFIKDKFRLLFNSRKRHFHKGFQIQTGVSKCGKICTR